MTTKMNQDPTDAELCAAIAKIAGDDDALETLETERDELKAELETVEDERDELIDELADDVGRYAGALAGSGFKLTDDGHWAIADHDRAAAAIAMLNAMRQALRN
jgi:vacuolar-type H+-ATPase subunit D/Vma8